MLRRFTTSNTDIISARSVRKNFNRAGTLANRFSTRIRVPPCQSDGRISPVSQSRCQPFSSAPLFVSIVIFDTDAIDGNASPRKPIYVIFCKLSSGNFDVAWRIIARCKSSRDIPEPLSTTDISVRPPSVTSTTIWSAPASSAFSTNSLTTDAGRSTTSPAAIWFTKKSGNTRTVIYLFFEFHFQNFIFFFATRQFHNTCIAHTPTNHCAPNRRCA